jgi:hypothetical protein
MGRRTTTSLFLRSVWLCLIVSGASFAQQLDGDEAAPSAPSYFYEPFPMQKGSSIFQLGISFSMLPEPIAEQEVPIPAIDVQYKRGIFDGVSLDGSLSTSIYSNILHAGVQWSTSLERFSFGVATHVGGAYGFMRQDNLFDDVHGYALYLMPILRFGFRLEGCAFSSSLVATYVFASESYVNGVPASVGPENTVNDLFCTLAVEQPFFKNLQVSAGLSLGYARTPYQSWMLYNTLDEWLFVPEFFFSVQL